MIDTGSFLSNQIFMMYHLLSVLVTAPLGLASLLSILRMIIFYKPFYFEYFKGSH